MSGSEGARARPGALGPLGRALRGLFDDVRKGRASFDTIRERFVSGSRLDGPHLCILIVAMLIASVGLNTDSTEAVIGAMLICPLMGSVLAISYSVATMDRRLLRDAILGLMVQVVICLATSALYFVVSPLSNQTNELVANSSPTVWDILVALAGGFAGGLGNSRRQEPATLIAGVAVATALMPPLCAAGYGIAARDLVTFLPALYEFVINVVFISLAAEVVLVLLRVPLLRDLNGDGVVTAEESHEATRRSRRMKARLAVATLLLAVPAVFVSSNVVRDTMTQNDGSVFQKTDQFGVGVTTRELSVICPDLVSYRVGVERESAPGSKAVTERTVATVTTHEDVPAGLKTQMEALIRIHAPHLDSVRFVVS
ncbi:DUF389 domain-containing protein [Olsenella sp. HMSC062G07]|uniref:DUF389 domain-containing protein n=1 Tax=Olsenella sp. HMSC062G07 TaxID=1739330 RepID=UPI000A70B1A2|nr:DUF389 domain-containing protein [Olsenella sp. HMSC062G07]